MGHLTPNNHKPHNTRRNFNRLSRWNRHSNIANLANIPNVQSTHPIIFHHHEQTLKHIVRLIQFLHNVQSTGIAYILANTPCAMLHPHIQLWLTPNIALDCPPWDSAAYTYTHMSEHTSQSNYTREIQLTPNPYHHH